MAGGGKHSDPYKVCHAVLNGEAYNEKEFEAALEAIGSSSNGPVLRGHKKEKGALHKPKKPKKPGAPLKPAKVHKIHTPKKFKQAEQLFRISESEQDEKGRLFFPVVVIREGLGNLRDRNYYLSTSIQSGVQAYEGAQAYYDHPSPAEEQQQPNRKVNELLGHYEDCKAVKGADGLMELQAKLFIIEGISRANAQDLLKHAVVYAKKYPDKSFVGLSINGDGEGETCEYQEFLDKYSPPPAALQKLKGIEGQTINAINKLTDAFSADVVTAAGAGGKVQTQESKEKTKMKFLEGFKKFWKAVDKGDFKTAEEVMKAITKEGEGEGEGKDKEKKEAEGGDVKKMLQAMKQAMKDCKQNEGESEKEYEARLEASVKDMLNAEAEKEKKEAEKKQAEDKDKEGEGKDKEKKEGEGEDDKDKDKDDDADDKDKKDKEKKEGEGEGEGEDDDGDDDDDADHKDAGKDKKLIAKMMKKHMQMAKQVEAMHEKMEKMSAELEKHESESKQSKKEAAEAKTTLALKAKEEMIDKALDGSGYPKAITKLWRPALAHCRTEKEITELVKTFKESASEANAQRFYVESSRGLLEKASEESGNNSDLFGIK